MKDLLAENKSDCSGAAETRVEYVERSSNGGGTVFESARAFLMSHYKYPDFLPGQEEALNSVFSGKDLLVVMPTGSGKSLIYQLPALLDNGLTIVISPLISLMKDQVDELERIGIPATFINSSLDSGEQGNRITACRNGRYKLLYIAPERCRNEWFLRMLGGVEVSRLAVDEAHCISQWGHDFRPDYRRIREFLDRVGNPPVTALTATATRKVRSDIIESLGLDDGRVDTHVHGFDRPNLRLGVVTASTDRQKMDYLVEFLGGTEGSGIIYAGTRKNTEELAELLSSVEPDIVPYHAGMQPEERNRTQEAFLKGEARVVVATTAFGMGIDKRDVRFVVHYNYPGSIEQYYQEIGRAGRDGLDSECVLLYSSADGRLREFFIENNYPGRETIEEIYNVLLERKENPVLLTHRWIGELCQERVNEGQVRSAIRVLSEAGAIRAFSGAPKVAITTREPYSKIKPGVRGPLQQRVLEAVAACADLDVPVRSEIELHQLAWGAGVSEGQVRRTLAALHESGIIQYEPPFRGRGIEKMPGEQPQFSELSIDWKHYEQLRKNEEDRLRTMEKFINSHGCRRGYILKYFGEAKAYSCGICDRCVAKKAVSGDKENLVKTEQRIALPVLGFLRFARFPLGKARIADVVTGSRNKQIIEWGLDRNPAYGLVDANRAEVKEVIENLMNSGYIEVTGDSHLPVLRLTERGKKAALEFNPEDYDRRTMSEAGASRKPDRSSSGEEIRVAVLKCVETVPYLIGTSKIAGVLTGSRAKWIKQSGVGDLEVYGGVNATQDDVKEIILEMIDDHSLQQKGSTLYPVLAITEKGRAKLKGEPKPGPEGKTVKEAARVSSGIEEYARVCCSPKPVTPLEALAGELLVARPEKAREMLPDVRKHKPAEIMDALINCSNDPECHGTRPRLIWCVGELCGGYGVDFLLDNLSSESSAIRKLTASALGKTGTGMKTGTGKDPLMMRKARQALEVLARDPNRQVREYAEKALKRF